jgi:hypothetical protein
MSTHYRRPELRPLNQWKGHVRQIPPRLSSFATGKNESDAGEAMTEVDNIIGGDGICDHWFHEYIPARKCPVENSFSPSQIFREQDERVRFDVA